MMEMERRKSHIQQHAFIAACKEHSLLTPHLADEVNKVTETRFGIHFKVHHLQDQKKKKKNKNKGKGRESSYK